MISTHTVWQKEKNGNKYIGFGFTRDVAERMLARFQKENPLAVYFIDKQSDPVKQLLPALLDEEELEKHYG